jgi:hypothetical protein
VQKGKPVNKELSVALKVVEKCKAAVAAKTEALKQARVALVAAKQTVREIKSK